MTARAPWLGHYDPGVPPSLAPYPTRTLLDYVVRRGTPAPGLARGAVQGRDADLRRARAAQRRLRRGARRPRRQARRSHRAAAAELPAVPDRRNGAWKIGAIVAPLNPTYTESELEGPLREHGIETIVTLTRFYERVKRVQPRTPLTRVIATNIKEYFPPLLRFLFTVVRERKEGDRIRLAPGDHAFAALLASPSRPRRRSASRSRRTIRRCC